MSRREIMVFVIVCIIDNVIVSWRICRVNNERWAVNEVNLKVVTSLFVPNLTIYQYYME